MSFSFLEIILKLCTCCSKITSHSQSGCMHFWSLHILRDFILFKRYISHSKKRDKIHEFSNRVSYENYIFFHFYLKSWQKWMLAYNWKVFSCWPWIWPWNDLGKGKTNAKVIIYVMYSLLQLHFSWEWDLPDGVEVSIHTDGKSGAKCAERSLPTRTFPGWWVYVVERRRSSYSGVLRQFQGSNSDLNAQMYSELRYYRVPSGSSVYCGDIRWAEREFEWVEVRTWRYGNRRGSL